MVSSAPMMNVSYTKNIESIDNNTTTWIEEVISIGTKRHQNTKCFNCGRIGHLRRYCREDIPRNNVPFGNHPKRRSQTSRLSLRCSKS